MRLDVQLDGKFSTNIFMSVYTHTQDLFQAWVVQSLRIWNVRSDLMKLDSVVQLGLMELDWSYGTSGFSFPILPQVPSDMSTWITNNIRCCRRWICRMIHSLQFWVQNSAKLYLLIKGPAYDPSQGPETIQIYFQTGGETYEHGWISWGEA